MMQGQKKVKAGLRFDEGWCEKTVNAANPKSRYCLKVIRERSKINPIGHWERSTATKEDEEKAPSKQCPIRIDDVETTASRTSLGDCS